MTESNIPGRVSCDRNDDVSMLTPAVSHRSCIMLLSWQHHAVHRHHSQPYANHDDVWRWEILEKSPRQQVWRLDIRRQDWHLNCEIGVNLMLWRCFVILSRHSLSSWDSISSKICMKWVCQEEKGIFSIIAPWCLGVVCGWVWLNDQLKRTVLISRVPVW